jgi:hypothetical protein
MVIEYTGTSGAEQYLTSTASGNPANQSTITMQNQTITFAALPTKASGDADFNPGATASSGLPVTYSSSNTAVATIVSGNIHIVGIGTSTITASQAGNSNYNAATSVDRSLTVDKANQTITFPSLSAKSPGNADFNPGATASSGLTVTYSSSNTAVTTIVSGNIHIVGAGTSTITASQAGNSNYNAATDVVQVLTVNKGTLVNEMGEEEIEIYPVPASDKLYIKIPGNKTAILQMVDISGQVVVNKKLTNQVETMDVSKLAKGMYTIKLKVNETLIIEKIEIQ